MTNSKPIVNLSYNKGYQWDKYDKTFFIGYAWQKEKTIGSAKELSEYLSKCSNNSDFLKHVNCLNGVFSFVYQTIEQIFLYSDKSRFFPIFYKIDKEEIKISDNFYQLKNESDLFEFEPSARAHFLAIGFTPGNKTLIDGIKQVKPAELLIKNKKEILKHNLYRHAITSNEIIHVPYLELKEEAKKTIDNAFDKHFKLIGNSPVLLPLSGGFDSRLIGASLRDFGLRNVTCFTFGRKTKEVEISKKVAEYLGYKWHFIEYTNELTSGFKINNKFLEYTKYASRGNAMFYLQEFPALIEMEKKGLLIKDSIVIPGHAGDVNGGSMITKTYPLNIKMKNLLSYLIKRRFIHSKLSRNELILVKNELSCYFENKITKDYIPYTLMEEWEYLERLPKYIFNSSHVFEFFKHMPFEYRLYQKLNHELLREAYFSKYNIDFIKDIQPSGIEIIISNIKQLVRPYLPYFYKRKLLIKNDWVEYGPITEILNKDLTTKHNRESYASYLNPILEWYLQSIEKEIK